jgi:hypothetical protein
MGHGMVEGEGDVEKSGCPEWKGLNWISSFGC